MAILESVFDNPNQQPNALMRFGMALQGPEAQIAREKLAMEKQKESQLQALLSQVGAVPQDGSVGPQQPIGSRDFLTQLAGITGDAGGLASFLVAEEKQKAEEAKRQQLATVLSGGAPQQPASPLQNFATSGNASGPNPLSVRNNNPGNMRPVGGSTGFQSFDSPQEGLNAMRKDLETKISGKSAAMASRFGPKYEPTLANVIATWAPPEENDTQAYVDFVSQQTGIAPDQPLSVEDIEKIQPAMIQMEGGGAASEYFAGQPQTEQPAQEPSYLQKFAQLAALDPAEYADEYLAAQQKEADKQLKAVEDAKKEAAERDKIAREGDAALTKGEQELRKEFEGLPDVKQFRDVEGAYQRVLKATKNPTAAGDVALIFNFMKMLDPGSTVREGEFATAAASAGLPDRMIAWAKKVDTGERLAPDQRQDFITQAGGQYEAASELFNVRGDQYEELAKGYQYKPERVVSRDRGKIPKKPAADAPDPELLVYMTPEERALFE